MNRRITAVAVIPSLLLLATACGSAPDASSSAPSEAAATSVPDSHPATSIDSLPHTARTLKVGESSAIVVRTLPQAACVLRGADPSAKGSMNLDTDDDGYLEVRLQPNQPSPRADFLLECTDSSGQEASQVIAVAADEVGDGIVAQRPLASTGLQRPALTGDLDAPSQRELVARGYPRRPDAATEGPAYARWREIVSQPYTTVSSRGVPHPERLRQPGYEGKRATRTPTDGSGFGINTTSSGTWSGAVMTNPWRRYWIVDANWLVPTLRTPPSPYPYFVPADAAEWVGMDGWNGVGSLVQSGSDSNTENYLFFIGGNVYSWTATTYAVWVQNFPNPPYFVPNMPTSPNDALTVEVWIADQYGSTSYTNGDLNSLDDTVWFWITNSTQHTQYMGTLPRPSSFAGATAEFIIERGQPYSNTTPVLADFGWQAMSNAEFGDTVWGAQFIYNGALPPVGTLNQVNMVNGSDNEDLAFVYGSVADGDPGHILFAWENP